MDRAVFIDSRSLSWLGLSNNRIAKAIAQAGSKIVHHFNCVIERTIVDQSCPTTVIGVPVLLDDI